MKKQMLAASICLTLLITGCKKQNDFNPNSPSTPSTTIHEEIEEQNGVLRFRDWATFKKTVAQLEKNEKVALPTNFISLNDVFRKVVEAEVVLEKEKGGNEIKSTRNTHSDLFKENQRSVYYTTLKDGSVILEMDIYSRELSQVVNKNGLVLINDSLFIFTRNKADVCLDYNKEILKNFDKSDYKSMGITATQIITIKKINETANPYSIANKVPCGYCYNDDYHYNTTVWNYCCSRSYQNILEVFVEQVRSNCATTETNVKVRGRFLTRFVGSGSWIPYDPTDIYFAGSFSGPRSPSNYYYSNGFASFWYGFGTDLTLTHCYDYNSAGASNCFIVSHATYQMHTAYAPFTNTDVIW